MHVCHVARNRHLGEVYAQRHIIVYAWRGANEATVELRVCESSKPMHYAVISIVLTPAFLVRLSVFFILPFSMFPLCLRSSQCLFVHKQTSQPVQFISISRLRFCSSSRGLVANSCSQYVEWSFSPFASPVAVQTVIFIVYFYIRLCLMTNGRKTLY